MVAFFAQIHKPYEDLKKHIFMILGRFSYLLDSSEALVTVVGTLAVRCA